MTPNKAPKKTTKLPAPPASHGPAGQAYARLVLFIQNFEAKLDNTHEMAMGFAGGAAGILRIEGVGFVDPDILTFYGRDEEGLKTQLIQHVSQLSFILRAVPRARPEEPPRRIGFAMTAGWAGGESGDASA